MRLAISRSQYLLYIRNWKSLAISLVKRVHFRRRKYLKTLTFIYNEHGWFERGVKEAIYVGRKHPSLNKGVGLRQNSWVDKDGEMKVAYTCDFFCCLWFFYMSWKRKQLMPRCRWHHWAFLSKGLSKMTPWGHKGVKK